MLAAVGSTPGRAADPVRIEIQADSGDRVVLQYRFDGYETRKVDVDGVTHDEIRIAGEPVFLAPGDPALPHVNRSLIIPGDAEMAVRVLDAEYHEISTRIAPSKGNLSRRVDPDDLPYHFGASYSTDAFFPDTLVELHQPYVIRDKRGIVVQVNPFRFNPARGTLRVYTEIIVEVAAVGPGKSNVIADKGAVNRDSRAFHDIYRGHFLNYSPPAGKDFDEEGSMLVLCHDDWIDNMAPFAAHKAAVGIDVDMVPISTVGNTSAAIQDYIQGVYDSSNLAFVLLVGDIAQITSPDVWANGEWGASDPSYSKLAGADDYPDILVGRFSAGSSIHVDTQVQRTIEYETDPYATEQDWFWRGTGIGSAEGAGIGDEGQSDIQHQSEIRGWLLGAGYTAVDQIYDPGATDDEVAAALNAGRGVVNYTGHGSASSWGTTGFNNTDINALTNVGMLPVILSVACNNGEFENYSACFGETWLRATHNDQPSGAAGVYASSVSQSWAPPMEGQDEFNLLLTDPDEPLHSFGGLCYGGSMSMMDAYGADGVEMFNTWIVFGDPSLRVRGLPIPPTGMKVTPQSGLNGAGGAGGPVAPGEAVYTVRNFDETPMDYAVTANVPWISMDHTSGTLPPGGSAEITVSFNTCACNMDHGSYEGLVEFVNLSRHDGDTQREVALSIGAPLLRDRFDLESDPGWPTEGMWEYGVPLGLGGWGMGHPDPTSGATGSNVFGVKLSGDVPIVIAGPYYLTLGPVDFNGTSSVVLKFQRWLNTQSDPPMSATIEVSSDGSTWNPVWSNVADVTDSSWTPMEYDISSTAANQGSVHVRWGYGVNAAGAQFCSGWNIDDVELWTATESVKTELTVEPAQLSWLSAGGAATFDVVKGDLAMLRGSGGDFSLATDGCVANDVGDTSQPFDDTPAAGQGIWFLVRGVSPAGPSTFQSLSGYPESLRDAEIDAAAASCP
jgi:hypothetical protein